MLVLDPKESKALQGYINTFGATCNRAKGLDNLIKNNNSLEASYIIRALNHHALHDLFVVCNGDTYHKGFLVVSEELKAIIQTEVNRRWLFLNSYIKDDVRNVNEEEAKLPLL